MKVSSILLFIKETFTSKFKITKLDSPDSAFFANQTFLTFSSFFEFLSYKYRIAYMHFSAPYSPLFIWQRVAFSHWPFFFLEFHQAFSQIPPTASSAPYLIFLIFYSIA